MPDNGTQAELERLYKVNHEQAEEITDLLRCLTRARATLRSISDDKYARQARFKHIDETVGQVVDCALEQSATKQVGGVHAR